MMDTKQCYLIKRRLLYKFKRLYWHQIYRLIVVHLSFGLSYKIKPHTILSPKFSK